MDDDDDWDTDPTFENNMTETERRRAGTAQHLEELSSATASMSMDAFRQRALSLDERAGEIDRASVRAEKAAADKRQPDATTTSTAALEKPTAPPAKPALRSGSLIGRWEENTRNRERDAAVAEQSRLLEQSRLHGQSCEQSLEVELKSGREAEAAAQKAEAEQSRHEALGRVEQERQAADREAQAQRGVVEAAKTQAVAEADAKAQSMMAEAQRMLAEATQIKAAAEAEARRTVAAAEAKAQVSREAGERAKREAGEQSQRQRQAEEQARVEEEARRESQAHAERQREADSRAIAAPPPPGYEGAVLHAQEQGWAQSTWRGAGSKVVVASRAVNAFAGTVRHMVPELAAAPAHVSEAPIGVGSKVWARPPEAEDEGEGEGGQWVPGRVLLHRQHAGCTQMKISLDGNDSETDKWVDCDSERVRPYLVNADAKAAARQEAAEMETSRLHAEQRKRDDRLELSLAASGLEMGLQDYSGD